MAENESGEEKTEDATSRRIQEARDKGDVAKSQEVPSAAVLLVGLLTIYFLGDYLLARFFNVLRYYLSNLHTIHIIQDNMTTISRDTMLYALSVVGPVAGAVFLAALIANYAQVGILFAPEKLTPSFDKLNPIAGISNFFSKQTLANLFKSLAKLSIVCIIAYKEIMKSLPSIPILIDQEPIAIFIFMCQTAFWIFLKAALFIALLAAIDYIFQRRQFDEKMKMTKQEIKEEAKSTEGDPQVKGRIRSIQMEMARKRMMEEVPSADVVITNPTHLAIALKYDTMTMTAPKVVAKGAGVIAQKIKEIAKEHGVAIVEDKPLARALYKSAEIDETIPENLFQAVAETLAYVYSVKNKSA
ncbi:MAG: flagellar biosynthesis protein FlhB [Desulfobulbaceae bacterium]|nr:flagellar biosynthesis protein FlhB [Desulfobulbaceae bacterium]